MQGHQKPPPSFTSRRTESYYESLTRIRILFKRAVFSHYQDILSCLPIIGSKLSIVLLTGVTRPSFQTSGNGCSELDRSLLLETCDLTGEIRAFNKFIIEV